MALRMIIVTLFVIARGSSAALFSTPLKLHFSTPLFSSGMILQRGAGTRLWGAGAAGPVTVTVKVGGSTLATAVSTPPTGPRCTSHPSKTCGVWSVSMPAVAAQNSTTVTAADGNTTSSLVDVAWGEVLLCGGQRSVCAPHPWCPFPALRTLYFILFYFILYGLGCVASDEHTR